MNATTLGPLDSVISCYAYENATTALGLLQSPNPHSLPPEMLSTLDNFIKVTLFSERIWIHSYWVELFERENQVGVRFLPEPMFGGAGKDAHEYFVSQELFQMLPRVETEEAWDRMAHSLGNVDPRKWPTCLIKLEIRDISTTLIQEMIVYDLLILEQAIKAYGLDRFKPVFPGEHIYLGLRGAEHSEQSLADVVTRKLRDSIRTKIRNLNTQQNRLGALSLPEFPPLFLLRLLSQNSNRRNLAKDLVTLRNSRPFVSFRKSAVQCHDMLESNDIALRSKASRLISAFQEIDLEETVDYVTLADRIVRVLKAVVAGFVGKVADPITEVFKLTNDFYHAFSQRPLLALKEFSSRKTDTKALDEFVKREFGDHMHAGEMQTISLLLGLPETSSDWDALDVSFSVSGGLGNSEYGLNGRPMYIESKKSITSADVRRTQRDMFGI